MSFCNWCSNENNRFRSSTKDVYKYDALSRIVKTTDPEQGYEAAFYDANNNKKRIKKSGQADARLYALHYTYDTRNLLIEETDAEGHTTSYD